MLVSASAIGYYGDRGDEILDETSLPGSDFLSEVCVAWEHEAQAAAKAGVRVVNVRLGLVLGKDGGALPSMLTPFRLGLGSPLGSGRQWMSWIHVEDVIGLLLLAAERTDLRGPLNATAPQPVDESGIHESPRPRDPPPDVPAGRARRGVAAGAGRIRRRAAGVATRCRTVPRRRAIRCVPGLGGRVHGT